MNMIYGKLNEKKNLSMRSSVGEVKLAWFTLQKLQIDFQKITNLMSSLVFHISVYENNWMKFHAVIDLCV